MGWLFVALTSLALSAAESPVDLLTFQSGDGEIAGWKAYQSEPGKKTGDVWKLDAEGVLTCQGQPLGYLMTDKQYKDVLLTFEWRWPAGGKPGNGGVLLRVTGENKIWPKSLEIQLNNGRAGDLWGLGGFRLEGPADRRKTMDHPKFGPLINVAHTEAVERPAGEWNQAEVRLEGGDVSVTINGKVVNRASDCELASGPLVLTAEGNEIQFRRVRAASLKKRPDVIYVPTPQEVVDKMLEMAEIKPGDKVYDLGCGDARFVVTAAKKFGVTAVGVDIDPQRIKESLENVKTNGVEHLVTIKQADIFTMDFSDANVVMLYLLPELNVRLMPQLRKLKPGSRIVSHQFDMRGAKPVQVVNLQGGGAEYDEGYDAQTIYKWVVPWEEEKENGK